MVVGAQASVGEWLWADVLEGKKRVERVLKEVVEALGLELQGGRDVWRGGPCTVPRIVAADCGAT